MRGFKVFRMGVEVLFSAVAGLDPGHGGRGAGARARAEEGGRQVGRWCDRHDAMLRWKTSVME